MKKIIQSPSWDRIVTILKNETLCVNELARRIGLERPHMIEAAKDPATGICPELAARIHYAFPAYSVEWLPHGAGPSPGYARGSAPAGGGIAVGALGIASYRALLERRPPSGRVASGRDFRTGRRRVGFRPGRSAGPLRIVSESRYGSLRVRPTARVAAARRPPGAGR